MFISGCEQDRGSQEDRITGHFREEKEKERSNKTIIDIKNLSLLTLQFGLKAP